MTTAIAIPDVAPIEAEGSKIVSAAQAIVVSNNEQMEEAGFFIRQAKTAINRIDSELDPSIKKAHEAHKEMVALKKRLATPFEQAMNIAKQRVGTYAMEQERIRSAEENRLREEARKQAEEEALAAAIELEREGSAEAKAQAEEIMAAPVAAPVVVVPSYVPKVQGISTRKAWKYRIVNEALIPRDYMAPDEKKIGAYCRSMTDKASMAGVEFFSEDVVSASGF